MTRSRKTTYGALKNTKGFTLIEILIVIAILSILASIAIANFGPLKQRASDSIALTDARHLVDAIIDAALSDEDIDYHQVDMGGDVGFKDIANNPRTPIFTLSDGVRATLNGTSNTIVTATVYHTKGTAGKSFFISVEESTGLTVLP